VDAQATLLEPPDEPELPLEEEVELEPEDEELEDDAVEVPLPPPLDELPLSPPLPPPLALALSFLAAAL
jgi:hypothetical protein